MLLYLGIHRTSQEYTMLFRPVFGQELAVVYKIICQSPAPLKRQAISHYCLPLYADQRAVSRQNLDDAISFLIAAKLVRDRSGLEPTAANNGALSFRLRLLQQLQALAVGTVEPDHQTDSLYFQLLDQLFIKPNRLYIADVHVAANKLRPVKEIGGISQEKIRSWRRVMAFLGVGQRIGQGFQCRYAPDLLLEILSVWPKSEGILQDLFEAHLVHYAPCQTWAGELAQAVSLTLLHLNQQQVVSMSAFQDSSSKPYFGEQRWRHIVVQGEQL
jgi:hypothetical protein